MGEPSITEKDGHRDDHLLTAEEVAQILRVTPAWIYAQTRCQALPHLRLGRYVRYRRVAIEAWMAGIEGGPSTHR